MRKIDTVYKIWNRSLIVAVAEKNKFLVHEIAVRNPFGILLVEIFLKEKKQHYIRSTYEN